jgi:protein-tyrosine-phosphatase
MTPTILFLCPHGAAKSIMAAAYFQRLANEQGLTVKALAAGTHPDSEISSQVAELLAKEGYDVSNTVPQLVTQDQITNASHVVSLGCDLDELPRAGTPIEQWDDVPPPSQDLIAARNTIYEHVTQLVEQYR